MAEDLPIFAIVPLEVAKDDRLTKMQIRVLLALLSFRAKNTDTVFPKRETLAERCGYSINTISRITTQLAELGWLEKEGQGGFSKANTYRITVPKLETVAEPETVPELETVASPATVAEPDTTTLSKPDTKPSPNRIGAKNKPLTDQGTDHKKRFSDFWDSWPQGFGSKGAKQNAEREFLKIKPDDQLLMAMIVGRDSQYRAKVQSRAAGQFTENFQHVERWLRNRRWEDEVNAVSQRVVGERISKTDAVFAEAFPECSPGGIPDAGSAIPGEYEIDSEGCGDYQDLAGDAFRSH